MNVVVVVIMQSHQPATGILLTLTAYIADQILVKYDLSTFHCYASNLSTSVLVVVEQFPSVAVLQSIAILTSVVADAVKMHVLISLVESMTQFLLGVQIIADPVVSVFSLPQLSCAVDLGVVVFNHLRDALPQF